MPLYEYRCEEDGAVLELMRPMDRADDPVEDPEGKGREFHRVHSTFAAKGAGASEGSGAGGCCPCGKGPGGCSRN